MKIIITRNAPDVMDYSDGNYNLQEIGLARALNKKGHQCDVVYSGGKTEKVIEIEYDKGKTFKLIYLRVIKIIDNGYLLGLDELISQYDVIHSGAYDQLRTWIFAKKYPNKLVVYQGPYASNYTKNYNKKCFLVDKIFVPRYKKNKITFITKSKLASDFLIEKGLIDVTSVGVGFDLEQMGSDKEKIEPLYSDISAKKNAGKKIVLYIGKIEVRRNVLFMLETLKKYLILYPEDDVCFLIVGKGKGKYFDRCKSFIRDNCLYNNVIWIDQIEQKYLPAIYKLADIFWLPTKYEIFGMVLLEAMYYGVPVLTTFNGGSSILIKQDYSGIISEESVDKWITNTHRILTDHTLADSIRTRAHNIIVEQFTWDALADRFIEVYRRKCNE